MKPSAANRFLICSWGVQQILEKLAADTFLKSTHSNTNIPMQGRL